MRINKTTECANILWLPKNDLNEIGEFAVDNDRNRNSGKNSTATINSLIHGGLATASFAALLEMYGSNAMNGDVSRQVQWAFALFAAAVPLNIAEMLVNKSPDGIGRNIFSNAALGILALISAIIPFGLLLNSINAVAGLVYTLAFVFGCFRHSIYEWNNIKHYK